MTPVIMNIQYQQVLYNYCIIYISVTNLIKLVDVSSNIKLFGQDSVKTEFWHNCHSRYIILTEPCIVYYTSRHVRVNESMNTNVHFQ